MLATTIYQKIRRWFQEIWTSVMKHAGCSLRLLQSSPEVGADCEVDGFPLRRRDNIVVLLGAANRDPEAFDDPDRLDVGRAARSHLALGRGIHYCLGDPLARLEGRIVLETLIERFPRIELLADRPRFRKSIVFRGLQALPVRAAA